MNLPRFIKIFALFVALAVVVGVGVIPRASEPPPLVINFTGYETNGTARFIVSNRSSHALVCLGPVIATREMMDFQRRILAMPMPANMIEPGGTETFQFPRPPEAGEWRAAAIYRRQRHAMDHVRIFLRKLKIPLDLPNAYIEVTSEVLTNPPPRP